MSESMILAGDERRAESDRRIFGWRTVYRGFTRSRRRQRRRDMDVSLAFIDWHHPWLFFLAVGTMLLSCVDAFLTLILLNHGLYEANPFMAAVMSQSTGLFVASKMALTGMGVMLLVSLSNTRFFNRMRTGLILTSFFTLYCCLVCYEIVSLFNAL